jgi:hypothetical protein
MMCNVGTKEVGWEDINWINLTQHSICFLYIQAVFCTVGNPSLCIQLHSQQPDQHKWLFIIIKLFHAACTKFALHLAIVASSPPPFTSQNVPKLSNDAVPPHYCDLCFVAVLRCACSLVILRSVMCCCDWLVAVTYEQLPDDDDV